MRSLIVPMMGHSTRYPSVRPKWLLTHPFGGFMGTHALKGLNLEGFDNIYFVVRSSHVKQYGFVEGFYDDLDVLDGYDKIKFVMLDEDTDSQPETVYRCIKQEGITGTILVKDSDNYFEAAIPRGKNCVCYFDLNDGDTMNARNKSYVQFDENRLISNIVEKRVVSSTFSVGGYGFASAEEFCTYFEKLQDSDSELYMSNVIFEMILDNHPFLGIKVENYEDWGTFEDWNRYKRTFRTLFVDLDGVLIENTSVFIAPFAGTGEPILRNIGVLRKLHWEGRTKIIITTARPEAFRAETIEELREHDIPFNVLLMGMPHCQRIIINDFAKSNPFPACDAINLKRNADNLEDYLS